MCQNGHKKKKSIESRTERTMKKKNVKPITDDEAMKVGVKQTVRPNKEDYKNEPSISALPHP